MKFYRDYKEYASELADANRIKIYHSGDAIQLSFTPYIYNACSANCRFCSEKIVRQGQVMVCDGICSDYIEKLVKAFKYAGKREIFLSLSGKEPSESVEHLEMIAEGVRRSEENGVAIKDRVLYSNLSGFVKNWDRLINVIEDLRVTRIECSRHHHNEEVNQNIVQFKMVKDQNVGEINIEKIKENKVFEETVRKLLKHVSVKMVCVLQKSGVKDENDVIKYLQFAKHIGVKDVVFRELAVFDNAVDKGLVTEYINENRVELMDILVKLSPKEFTLQSICEGYYYYSFTYQYGEMNVSFEMSDYEEMIKNHNSSSLHKLILYPNGDLCKDWNMKGKVKDWC